MKMPVILFSVMVTFLSLSASAAVSMKPGLWEHSFTMKSESGRAEKAMAEMKKQMASMPAEQRKMIEDMMAKQGVGIVGKGSSVKVCISKEQAEKLDFPQNQMENCKQEIVQRTSDSLKIKFNCEGTPKTTGEADFKLSSPTAYTGKAIINTTEEGKADRMDMNATGKWLAADCGNIKSVSTNK